MSKYEECIENLINGNLEDAKNQAGNLTMKKLDETMRGSYGFSHNKAAKALIYLLEPCEETFQNYCDQK